MLAKVVDLLAVTHVDGDRDSATASPLPISVTPRQVIEERRRTLVGTRDVNQVAQVDGAVGSGNANDDIADRLRIRKETGRINGEVFRPDVERSGGQRNVLGPENVFQL